MMFRVMLPCAFALMLAACADCTQDPSQAGFFCGIRNIAEGTYENRQTAMRREAEQVEVEAQRRGDQLRSLQSQEASLAADKEDLLAKLASIQADLDKQKRLLAEARLQRQANRDKLAELEMHLSALQDKRAQLARSRTISGNEVKVLKYQTEELTRGIRKINPQVIDGGPIQGRIEIGHSRML